MAEKIKYYLHDEGELWKKEDGKDFYFSSTKLEWIESRIYFILPSWDYENALDPHKAEEILSAYKADGKWEEEETPLRYFANDNDSVYAEDIYGKEFYVLADMTLKPARKGTVDCMWGGLTREEAEDFCKKEYKKDDWIMVNCGRTLVRYIGDDYIGTIRLEEDRQEGTEKEKLYRAEIQLDDGMDYPYVVSYLEATSLEELKKKTERKMKERKKERKKCLQESPKLEAAKARSRKSQKTLHARSRQSQKPLHARSRQSQEQPYDRSRQSQKPLHARSSQSQEQPYDRSRH
ncbi:MAG: hypothetical protein K5930_08910 [Treponemataceae bacterium]|nr:hypothetical protein [Treponemataceae bacterium]